ncbi:MAG: hypothetical protein KF868_01550 [Acidobacteria bacterium]|nr:hypothetical protein [Acidobacteriota bacterium]MCW5969589.1 hypothetical protein [Blastocatellales bacterium]
MPKSREKERALVRRVKKVVKKSRRKLGDEKFEKELQRTIAFLARLQNKLGGPESAEKKRPARKAPAKSPAKQRVRSAANSDAKPATRTAAKRTRNTRK